MAKDCLLLNSDAQVLSLLPLSYISWKEAIKMKYENSAIVIAEYDIECRSPSVVWKIPAILMLKTYKKVSRNVRFSRYNLFLRDNFQCQYCGIDMKNSPNLLSLDHVIPKKMGGKTIWENVVTACVSCNSKRGHDLNIKPNSVPYKPTIWDLYTKRRSLPLFMPHKSWQDFLCWDESLIVMI